MEIREVVNFHHSRVKFMTLQELYTNNTWSLIRDPNKICEHLRVIKNEYQVWVELYCTCIIKYAVSLSTLVLNSRDRQGNLWLPQKCIYKTTLQQYFPSKYCHKIYWYDAISTINPFKKLKRALESKLSNFKNFENC